LCAFWRLPLPSVCRPIRGDHSQTPFLWSNRRACPYPHISGIAAPHNQPSASAATLLRRPSSNDALHTSATPHPASGGAPPRPLRRCPSVPRFQPSSAGVRAVATAFEHSHPLLRRHAIPRPMTPSQRPPRRTWPARPPPRRRQRPPLMGRCQPPSAGFKWLVHSFT